MTIKYTNWRQDIILLFLYLVLVLFLQYFYPYPHFSYDSFYYIDASVTHINSFRPILYSYLLSSLYYFSHNIHLVVWFQHLIYFLSCIIFIRVIRNIFDLNSYKYIALGLILITEPISLYHANSILSDSIFTSASLLFLSSLLAYLFNQKYWFLIIHIAIAFICIEIRHLALFYPFFSCIALMLFSKRKIADFLGVSLILLLFFIGNRWHSKQNENNFGVSVYSPFSGWTQTNNALYALPRIRIDPKYIANPEIRSLHTFFKTYMDSTSYVPYQVGSAYMWEDRSPMNILRKKIEDSLHVNYVQTWYLLAKKYNYYGLYIQKNYPYEYFMGFMFPNIKTLVHPHIGEMGDYFCTKFSDNDYLLISRYNIPKNVLKPNAQIYKNQVNNIIYIYYKVVLILFVAICIYYFFRAKKYIDNKKSITILILFVLVYYLLMLYSSWFMMRYIMATFLIMNTTIFLMLNFILKGSSKSQSTIK